MASVGKNNLKKVAQAMAASHRSLRLAGIPHWATPDDVRRMAERSKADGIVDVKLHSREGLPTGEASIEFWNPQMAKRAAMLMNKAQISAIPVHVAGYAHARYKRSSPHSNNLVPYDSPETAEAPATTLIYGFPKKFSVADVRTFLADYRLSTFGTPMEAYIRLLESGKQSRWAIRLTTLSDAHRLVRHLHMKRFTLGEGGETTLGARVLY